MAAQKGKDLLLKVDADGDGTFVSVAGMRSRRISFNAETVDVSDFESAGRWRELLSGTGMQRASISGSGIFKDKDSDAQIRQLLFSSTIVNWQLIIPNFGILEGPFQITTLEYAGEHSGEITYEMSLESAGAISFGVL